MPPISFKISLKKCNISQLFILRVEERDIFTQFRTCFRVHILCLLMDQHPTPPDGVSILHAYDPPCSLSHLHRESRILKTVYTGFLIVVGVWCERYSFLKRGSFLQTLFQNLAVKHSTIKHPAFGSLSLILISFFQVPRHLFLI